VAAIVIAPWYCTRESVKAALDSAETAQANADVDDAIAATARNIDRDLCRRPLGFYPTLATRTFDWPNELQRGVESWRLWLDDKTLIELTGATSGGVAIIPAQVLLRPDTGPPFTSIELDRATNAAFGGRSTRQRNIALTGLWGWTNAERPGGALAEALDDSETAVDITATAAIGVGSLIRVGTERMIVTDRRMLSTGQTLQAPLTAQANATTVAVADGSAFAPREVLLVDGEKLRVDDITGNTLIVKRAWDGTALAAHTGSTIYAPRTLTVARGACGTTATEHDPAAPIAVWQPPTPLQQLNRAEAVADLLQSRSGYARVIGSGEHQREASGRGIDKLRAQVRIGFGRRGRHRAV
jgi:hypothetical protein